MFTGPPHARFPPLLPSTPLEKIIFLFWFSKQGCYSASPLLSIVFFWPFFAKKIPLPKGGCLLHKQICKYHHMHYTRQSFRGMNTLSRYSKIITCCRKHTSIVRFRHRRILSRIGDSSGLHSLGKEMEAFHCKEVEGERAGNPGQIRRGHREVWPKSLQNNDQLHKRIQGALSRIDPDTSSTVSPCLVECCGGGFLKVISWQNSSRNCSCLRIFHFSPIELAKL